MSPYNCSRIGEFNIKDKDEIHAINELRENEQYQPSTKMSETLIYK